MSEIRRDPSAPGAAPRQALSLLLLGALLIVALLLLAQRAEAQAPVDAPLPPAGAERASVVAPLSEAAPAVIDGQVAVLVLLTAPPAADAWLAAAAAAGIDGGAPAAVLSASVQGALAAAAQAQVAAVAAQQETLSGALAQLGAVEIYRAQRVYNAIAVRIPRANLGALRGLPGVLEVRYLLPKSPAQTSGVAFLGLPSIWQGTPDSPLRGNGIRVGVIDTGIDYLHVHFGGPGEGYELNDTTVITDLLAFPGSKVVGGWDFAGDSYNADAMSPSFQPIPMPDPDPMDCYGHGTHVAGIVAGYGVTVDGETWTGPFDEQTPIGSMRIGPGVAPGALLYALKVFGCQGQSDLVDLALEWAVDPNGDGDFADRLDVINLSLGSPLGSPLDSTAIASNKAAELGVFVVASAGNSGEVHYVAGSPGVATRALTVAATQLPQEMSLYWPGSRADVLASFSSLGPRRVDSLLKPEIAAPGVRIVSALTGSGSGNLMLSGTSMAAPHIAGTAAILRGQRPLASVEELKALLINTAAPVIREVEDYTGPRALLTRGGSGRVDLKSALDTDVYAFNADAPGLVTLAFGAPEIVDSQTIVRNLRVVNSGAEQRDFDLFYTPASPDADMAGVSVEILRAPALSMAPNGVENVPVAVTAVAAQMVNTNFPAPMEVDTTPAFLEAEAGYLWLWPRDSQWSAVATGLKVTPPNTSTVTALAAVEFSPTTRLLDWSLTLANAGGESVARVEVRRGPTGAVELTPAWLLFDRGADPPPTQPVTGSVVISPGDLPLLAGGYLNVAVTLAPSGQVILGALETDRPVLKAPLHVAPRPASAMSAAVAVVDFGVTESAQRPIPLAGTALAAGGAPTSTVALLSALELQIVSPRAPEQQNPPTPPRADIKFVGVTSDLQAAGSVADATVAFALVTFGRWNSPLEVLFNVYVDVNGDNSADYIVSNGVAGLYPNDNFVVTVENLATRESAAYGPLNGLQRFEYAVPQLNSDTMILSVPAAALGLGPGRTSFSFFVTTAVRVSDGPSTGDQSARGFHDVARPGLVFTAPFVAFPTLPDRPGESLLARLNSANYTRSNSKGILLIHHHNANSTRVEVVAVKYAWPYNYVFPVAWGPPAP